MLGKNIRNRWPAESFPRSMWVKKFTSNQLDVHSLQSLYETTKMCRRCSWHTKNTWRFLYLFLWSMICQNKIEEILYPRFVSLWAILLQDVGIKCWLFLVPGTVFDLAKRSSSSARILTISSWLTPKNVMEGISLTHK